MSYATKVEAQEVAGNEHGYATAPSSVPLLEKKTHLGRLTILRQRRTQIVFSAMFLLGLFMAWLGSPAMQALGLGVMAPGGGFLLHATGSIGAVVMHSLLFVGTLLLFVAALILWVATGNIVAPVVIWVGSAWWAASMQHGAIFAGARILLPLGILAGVIALIMAVRKQRVGERERRDRINQYLVGRQTAVTVTEAATGLPKVAEIDANTLPLLRYMLDRALQPVDEFKGFDKIDEFREAAKRYQISILSYGLANQTYAHTPAFRGYVAEAQHKLGLKMQDHRCWSYWALENAWGNLRFDPNPIPHDNIMYSGWYGAMLGMMATSGNDHSFNAPESIRLVHPSGKVYAYRFTDFCEAMYLNFKKSDFCLFPCEPRWIYPMCNNFGAIALITHDRLYGSHYWSDISADYRKHLESEFVSMDGRIVAIRDYRSGLTVPALTSAMADSAAMFYLNGVFPDLARRSWEIIRHDFIQLADGAVEVKTNGWDHIDFGNYRRSKISTYALVATAAREMGDYEVADKLVAKIDAVCPPKLVDGVRFYPGASTSVHSLIFQASNLRANSIHDLIRVGMPKPWLDGPLLNEAKYPEVMVTKAVSDGTALDLVLHPGIGGGSQSLGLAQLRPHQTYRVSGDVTTELVADAAGHAKLNVDLTGRTQLLIHPAV